MGVKTNESGQIIGDTGFTWVKGFAGSYFSHEPTNYFIDRLDGSKWYTLYRNTASSLPTRQMPFVRQRIFTGSVAECMRAAEIYDVRRR
jgi:hypothetical protein